VRERSPRHRARPRARRAGRDGPATARQRRRRDIIERYVADVLALDGLAPNVVTIDWAHELLAAGVVPTRDPRLWYLARMRLDVPGLTALAAIVARHVRAIVGGRNLVWWPGLPSRC
jgi:hypothetical protein